MLLPYKVKYYIFLYYMMVLFYLKILKLVKKEKKSCFFNRQKIPSVGIFWQRTLPLFRNSIVVPL